MDSANSVAGHEQQQSLHQELGENDAMALQLPGNWAQDYDLRVEHADWPMPWQLDPHRAPRYCQVAMLMVAAAAAAAADSWAPGSYHQSQRIPRRRRRASMAYGQGSSWWTCASLPFQWQAARQQLAIVQGDTAGHWSRRRPLVHPVPTTMLPFPAKQPHPEEACDDSTLPQFDERD